MININIYKNFKRTALRFSFVGKSHRMVLLGPSGSGKSLILKMIAGFFNPEKGEISIGDQVLFCSERKICVPIFQRNTGYLPQEYTLFPNMTVKENIQYGVKVHKIPLDKGKFMDLVARFDMGAKLDQYPGTLSGGQKQRAALARVLLLNPRILLLDEPFSALDTSIRESLRDLVIEVADELKIPTLFVTHDFEEAFIFGKEIVLIQNGKVVEFGDRNQVFNRPVFVETSKMLGFMNFWSVSQVDANRVKTENGHTFTFSERFSKKAEYLCIRPENIMILREDKPYKNKLRQNVVGGTVRRIHHRGRYVNIVFCSLKGLVLHINVPEHAFNRLKLFKGKEIKVSLKEESIILCSRLVDNVGK